MTIVQADSTRLIQAGVTNQSTRGGQPVAARLKTEVVAFLDGIRILNNVREKDFAPGETYTEDISLTIPSGTEGQTGRLDAFIYSPDNRLIASDSEELTVEAEAVPVMSFSMIAKNPPPGVAYWFSYFWFGGGMLGTNSGAIPIGSPAVFSNLPTLTGDFSCYAYDRYPDTTVYPVFWTDPFRIPMVAQGGAVYSFDFATQQITLVSAPT